MTFTKTAQMAAAILATFALPALAETSTKRVAANTDWSTFVDGNPKKCWVVSAPKVSESKRDGKAVAVNRGDIRLFVTYSAGSPGEISFSGGYPFAPASTVGLDVSGTKFDLSPDTSVKDWAWPGAPEDDGKIIAALKAGSSAIVTGKSAKGTQTTDTFSLSGFSAAVDEAAKRCAN